MIKFKDVNRDNYNDIIDMELPKSQRGFMEENIYSLAQCYIFQDYIPKAIYDNEELIGFILYYFVPGDENYVYLHRYMIDPKFQGKGYGYKALNEALNLFKEEFPNIDYVELMYYPDNTAADMLYQKAGFVPTGELRKSEPCRSELNTNNKNRFEEVVCRKYYNN